MQEKYGITYYLTAEDERYPILVLQGEFGSVGYSLDKDTGELSRVCICAAYESSECACGAWDAEEVPSEWEQYGFHDD